MNKAGFLFLGAVMSMGSLLFATSGCGDDTSGAGGSGGGSSSSGSGSSSSKSSGSGSGSGSSSSAGNVAATCANYCKDIQANCTGANQQYADEATCLKVCASFPQGAVGAMAGNSLECRAYHAGAPSKTGADMHCNHAGILGGDKDPAATTDMAPCGPGCDAFCAVAVKNCAAIWATEDLCKADCAKFKASTDTFDVKDTAGDTINCRAYHLTVATQTPAPHCDHIKLDNAATPCK